MGRKIEEDNIINFPISASQIAIRQLRFYATSKDIVTLLHYISRGYTTSKDVMLRCKTLRNMV